MYTCIHTIYVYIHIYIIQTCIIYVYIHYRHYAYCYGQNQSKKDYFCVAFHCTSLINFCFHIARIVLIFFDGFQFHQTNTLFSSDTQTHNTRTILAASGHLIVFEEVWRDNCCHLIAKEISLKEKMEYRGV